MSTAAFGLASDTSTSSGILQSSSQSNSVVPWNNRVLVAILGMVIGTGGVANAALVDTIVRPSSGTNSHIRLTIRTISDEAQNGRQDALLPQEQIAGIQRYLSLNVTDMSKALRVGRPTIYSWMRGTQPHGAHLHRIQQLYHIARSWRAISSSPIRSYLTVPLQTSGSLIMLLSEETLDEGAINKSFRAIKAASDNKPRRESVIEVATRRGLRSAMAAKSKRWSSDDEFDL